MIPGSKNDCSTITENHDRCVIANDGLVKLIASQMTTYAPSNTICVAHVVLSRPLNPQRGNEGVMLCYWNHDVEIYNLVAIIKSRWLILIYLAWFRNYASMYKREGLALT